MTRLAYGLRLCSTVARRSARPPHHTPLTSGLAGARRQVSQVPNPGDPSPLPNTLDNGSEGKQQQQEGNGSASSNAASGLRDTVVTTACGIALLALGGIGYHQWYKWDQLRKIAIAFEAGYDPVLELDSTSNVQQEEERRSKAEDELEYFPHEDAHLRRSQQALVDRIVDGVDQGHYWLVMGRQSPDPTSQVWVEEPRAERTFFSPPLQPKVLEKELCLSMPFERTWQMASFVCVCNAPTAAALEAEGLPPVDRLCWKHTRMAKSSGCVSEKVG